MARTNARTSDSVTFFSGGPASVGTGFTSSKHAATNTPHFIAYFFPEVNRRTGWNHCNSHSVHRSPLVVIDVPVIGNRLVNESIPFAVLHTVWRQPVKRI